MRDDFTKFSTISQWFQTLIHPALMQRPKINTTRIQKLVSPSKASDRRKGAMIKRRIINPLGINFRFIISYPLTITHYPLPITINYFNAIWGIFALSTGGIAATMAVVVGSLHLTSHVG